MDIVVNAFGTSRILFGSDWPVCLVAASYEEVLNITKDYFSAFFKRRTGTVFWIECNSFLQLIMK
jgi:L-fuconolactonase